jgi:AcrR family transcriptional regulator
MTRAAVPEARAKLLQQVVDYIVSHGLADLSLRPMAAAIDTSPRMLLYFFGSKERLVTEALTQIRSRQQQDFARNMLAPNRKERLSRVWDLWTSPQSEQYLWLFFEVYALALRNRKRFPGFLERLVKDWLPFFEQAFASVGVAQSHVQPLATLALAAVRGLQLDLLATAERARTDAAFHEMLRLLSLSSRAAPAGSNQPAHRKKRN